VRHVLQLQEEARCLRAEVERLRTAGQGPQGATPVPHEGAVAPSAPQRVTQPPKAAPSRT
jgi:hypothetical protein